MLKSRFDEFSAILSFSADSFADTDLDAALRLQAIADLNSGDPYSGR